MIADHLERAAIEIHYALADLHAAREASSPLDPRDETRTLASILRFALAELEWVCGRIERPIPQEGPRLALDVDRELR
jgi:hypothetical protein